MKPRGAEVDSPELYEQIRSAARKLGKRAILVDADGSDCHLTMVTKTTLADLLRNARDPEYDPARAGESGWR